MRAIKKTMLVLSLILCFLMGGSFLNPTPAYAGSPVVTDPANFAATMMEWGERLAAMAKKSALLGQIISLITSVHNIINSGFSAMTDSTKQDTKLNIAGQQGLALIKQEGAQAWIDSDTSDALLAAQLKLVADHVAPKNEYLCKATLLNQLTGTTEDFERGVARLVLKAIESTGRGPMDDYDGPQYAFDEETLRGAAGFGNSVVDGYDAAYSDTSTTVGPTKRLFIDADLMPFSMDGAVPLELPQFTAKAVNLPSGTIVSASVPTPQNENQRMWLAGLYYCFQLAGPRPTASWGDKMTTPQGLVERARFDHALAMQSAMIKPCADLLAYHTRPDSKDLASAPLIKAQHESCAAAKGYISDEDMKEKFSNCLSDDFKGMSAYQAELLSHSICKSEHHAISLRQAGATPPELINDTIKCSAAWNTWQAKVSAKQGSLVDVVAGIQETKGNWGGIGNNIAGLAEQEKDKAHRVVRASKPSHQPPVAQDIKAQKIPLLPRHGIPFAADEVTWPMAVSQ